MTTKPLQDLVDEFISLRRPALQAEVSNYRSLADESAVVDTFGVSISTGDTHRHARHISVDVRDAFREVVRLRVPEIKKSLRWPEVELQVRLSKVSGIGDMQIYDMTYAICTYKNIPATYIGLHRGTKVGYKRLQGKSRAGQVAYKWEFPSELQALSEVEIEDFLCHFRDQLSPCAIPAASTQYQTLLPILKKYGLQDIDERAGWISEARTHAHNQLSTSDFVCFMLEMGWGFGSSTTATGFDLWGGR